METLKDRLLTAKQVCERLSCSLRHVYNLIELGHLPAFKIGSRNGFRIRESKFEEFLKKREEEEGLF